jgi:hypothetical protein
MATTPSSTQRLAGDQVFQFADSDRDLRFRPAESTGTRRLTADEVASFNADGFLSPLPCLTIAQADDLRGYVDWLVEQVVSADDRRNSYSINQYHRVCATLHDLLGHEALVDYATDILGPRTVTWGAHVFCKLPGDGMEVPPHQDADYWPFTPTHSVTLWLAVDDVDADPFTNTLAAGQVSMHTDLLVHRSGVNSSGRRRCGIAIKYIGADVRAVAGGEDWIKSAVHVAEGDPSGYWPNLPRPAGEEPGRMARFVGGFDGNR